MKPRPRLYIFGWPNDIGGVETKLDHLLDLLHEDFCITVVPHHPDCLRRKRWTDYMDTLGVKYRTFDNCHPERNDIALAIGNLNFFASGQCGEAANSGMKIIWSYESVAQFAIAEAYIRAGIVDNVLFVSEFQRRHARLPENQKWDITGNYINSERFPILRKRSIQDSAIVGRLSRPDPDKFPTDFPRQFESFGNSVTRFRIMAWNETLSDKYTDHQFSQRWEFLEALSESTVDFLNSLDLFVYDPGSVLESWGRSTVEAMLCGAVPIVPVGHHFDQLILDRKCGYLCESNADFQQAVENLSQDGQTRSQFSQLAREYAVDELCNRKQHIERWKHALLN